ncbi:hypothetical protein HAX54_007604 [Datura stramonium]|uniref:Uncharacterized protein n=1 Tax=Datura stramonium TaxID=4076 RepID=A0ABS8RV08_DATST|nr:hypothetical protein [Datura stramonium]
MEGVHSCNFKEREKKKENGETKHRRLKEKIGNQLVRNWNLEIGKKKPFFFAVKLREVASALFIRLDFKEIDSRSILPVNLGQEKEIKYRGMQDQRGLEEALAPKLRKKKTSQQKAPVLQKEGNKAKRIQDLHALPIQNGLKPTKRVPPNEVSPLFQYAEKSTPEFSQDTSTSGNEYRALRRKYLLLEEESFALGKELREAEDEIKALEDEKLTLLDELVVLEGLADPSEIQSQGQRL